MVLLIEWISTWAEQIIVAVIIATIIEMILPSGNNKKYIKAVIGVYILFTIISPILGKITNIDLSNIDYEKYFEGFDNSQEMSSSLVTNNDKSIEEIYISNIKQDMKLKLQKNGYTVDNIELEIEFINETNYGNINWIYLTLHKAESKEDKSKITNTISVNKIEQVKIRNSTTNTTNESNKEKLDNNEINEIKEYLAGVYEIRKGSISINE